MSTTPKPREATTPGKGAARDTVPGSLASVAGAAAAAAVYKATGNSEAAAAASAAAGALFLSAWTFARKLLAERRHKGRTVLLGGLVLALLTPGCAAWQATPPADREIVREVSRTLIYSATTQLVLDRPERAHAVLAATQVLLQDPPQTAPALESDLLALLGLEEPRARFLAEDLARVVRIYVQVRLGEPQAPIPAVLLQDVLKAIQSGVMRASLEMDERAP